MHKSRRYYSNNNNRNSYQVTEEVTNNDKKISRYPPRYHLCYSFSGSQYEGFPTIF